MARYRRRRLGRRPLPPFVFLLAAAAVLWLLFSSFISPFSSVQQSEAAMSDRLQAPDYALLSPVMINYPLTPPVSGKITSAFGYRTHPVTQELDFHTGLDIAAADGTDILAALPGEVTEVGYNSIYGNYIVLSHGENIRTRYCHCSEILAAEGEKLREGDRIARVGSTGMVTGAHLHFEVYVDDLLADPAYVLEVRHSA
ncbi:MAG: M23 family metallopeptidase [Clostridiales bacterium]|nr:M23 family metallopeptidase [Clostridiales bacterium]